MTVPFLQGDSVWFDVGISVNVDDLKVLHSLVQSVASKWEEIGKQLPPYKHQVAKDKDTLHETLNSWLKHTKPCSLQQLCAALRHETVNETELSGRLKREFLATKSKFVLSCYETIDNVWCYISLSLYRCSLYDLFLFSLKTKYSTALNIVQISFHTRCEAEAAVLCTHPMIAEMGGVNLLCEYFDRN